MKQKLKKDEISWLKIKLLAGGGEGMCNKYCYLRDVGGRVYVRNECPEDSLPPHDDLIKLIKSLRIIVAKIENVDYARRIINLPGFDPTPIQTEMTEAAVQESMKCIEVTGLSFSERKKEDGVIISYSRTDLNDKITGHSTTWISLAGEIYGIEEDLEDICKQIKDEAFEYEFGDKYADFEQLSLFDKRKKPKEETGQEPEPEDAKIVE